jgi:hypothetical protein
LHRPPHRRKLHASNTPCLQISTRNRLNVPHRNMSDNGTNTHCNQQPPLLNRKEFHTEDFDSSDGTLTPRSSITSLPNPTSLIGIDINSATRNDEYHYDAEQSNQQAMITAKILLLQFFIAFYTAFNWLTHFHLSPRTVNTLCEQGSSLISMANLSPAILLMVLVPGMAIFTTEWLSRRVCMKDVVWALDYWLVIAGLILFLHLMAAFGEPDQGMCSRR